MLLFAKGPVPLMSAPWQTAHRCRYSFFPLALSATDTDVCAANTKLSNTVIFLLIFLMLPICTGGYERPCSSVIKACQKPDERLHPTCRRPTITCWSLLLFRLPKRIARFQKETNEFQDLVIFRNYRSVRNFPAPRVEE